ncbi:MAG: RHS repeat-associated core domain-containing protein [Janthinobacterium lividum]
MLFARPNAGTDYHVFNRLERLDLTLDQAGNYRLFNLDERRTYCFAPLSAGGEPHVLRRVEDANGFAITLTYDAQGQLRTLTDSAGRQVRLQLDAHSRIRTLEAPRPDGPDYFTAVSYQYDEAGNLTAVTDALGYTVRYAYQGHLLIQKTSASGVSFHFEYDGTGPAARCVHTWGDGGLLNGRFTYEPGRTTITSTTLGDTSLYEHTDGLITRHTDPLGAVCEWTYNVNGDLVLERDPLGRAISYAYDTRGNQTQITSPDKRKESTQYNSQDLPVQVTAGDGSQWQWTYDEAGNLLERTDPLGESVRYTYANGLIATISEGAIELRYDQHHNLARVHTPDGHTRALAYDGLGRLLTLTDALGHMERRYYDFLGQLTGVQDRDGSQSYLRYDGDGNIVYAQDAQQTVEMRYNGVGQLASRQQAGVTTTFTYDSEGRLTGLTNGHNQHYHFVLDLAGRVLEEHGFDGQIRRYAYDSVGRLLAKQLPSGRTTRYVYDNADQVTEVAHDDGSQQRYAYAPDGTLLEAANAHARVRFSYDAHGLRQFETQNSHTVTSTYDAWGNRVAVHSSLGAAISTQRDAYGRAIGVHAGPWQSRMERDANGRETSRHLSGGLRTHWQRDAQGLLLSQIVAAPGTTRRRRYQWQAANQLSAIDDSLLGFTSYKHDATGALTAAHYADGTQELRQLDAVGNLFRSAARTDCQYGPDGQVREVGGTRYRYDADGNRVQKTTATGQVWHYAWDGAGQLASVKCPNGYTVTFTYDALGRRLSKRYRGRVTHWVWDGNQPLHEWHELELGPGAGSVQDVTTWLFEDERLAPLAKLTAQGAYSVVCDHLGTPLEMYDATGTPTWRAQLDSYGVVRQGQGQAQDCPFRYQGQYEDVETGLYYNRFRYYDPEQGVYISPDPLGLAGGGALHAYVADPLTQLDVLGLSEGSDILGKKLLQVGHTHGIPGFVKNDFRAHHVIPHKVWTDNQDFFDHIGLGKKAGRNGMNPKDAAANGVFMPKNRPVATSHGFDQYHSGSHPNTSADMRGEVENIRDRYDMGRGSITRNQARKEISALQKAERKRLSSRRGLPCIIMP